MNTQPQIIHADVLIDRKASTIAAPCAVSIDDESWRTMLADEKRRFAADYAARLGISAIPGTTRQALRDASGEVSASAIAPQRT